MLLKLLHNATMLQRAAPAARTSCLRRACRQPASLWCQQARAASDAHDTYNDEHLLLTEQEQASVVWDVAFRCCLAATGLKVLWLPFHRYTCCRYRSSAAVSRLPLAMQQRWLDVS